MLASKGFHSMMTDWLQVVDSNHIDSSVIERNIASHRLADNICRSWKPNLNNNANCKGLIS